MDEVIPGCCCVTGNSMNSVLLKKEEAVRYL